MGEFGPGDAELGAEEGETLRLGDGGAGEGETWERASGEDGSFVDFVDGIDVVDGWWWVGIFEGHGCGGRRLWCWRRVW